MEDGSGKMEVTESPAINFLLQFIYLYIFGRGKHEEGSY